MSSQAVKVHLLCVVLIKQNEFMKQAENFAKAADYKLNKASLNLSKPKQLDVFQTWSSVCSVEQFTAMYRIIASW